MYLVIIAYFLYFLKKKHIKIRRRIIPADLMPDIL